MKHAPLWRGIAKHGAGWRATVSQGRGKPLVQKHFPTGTDPRLMQRWRADTKAELRVTRKQRATMGSFEYDAKRYLDTITALPTYPERARDIRIWVDIFGTQPRSTITPAQIRQARDRWLTEPRSTGKPPLAAGTVNKRLRALSNLYRVLDGPDVPNPVRRVPEAREPHPEPKALDYDTIARIIAHIPDADRPRKGHARGTVSLSKIRLRCLAYCPITPKQLKQLEPADLANLERGLIRLPARKKGQGSAPIWQPLLEPARAAFADFDAVKAYGPFSQSSLRKTWAKAAKRAGLTGHVTVYMLRHSFAALAYRATKSLEAVGRLLQHRQKATTARYAMSADEDVLAATVASVADHFGITDREESRITVENRGVTERPIVPVPTHTKGGNRLGRPRKTQKTL